MEPTEPADEHRALAAARARRNSIRVGVAALVIIPINFVVWVSPTLFHCLCGLQLVLGLVAAGFAVQYAVYSPKSRGAMMAFGFVLVALGGPLGWLVLGALQAFGAGLGGGAWGRPLRLRGRILHPELRAGSDWTRGATPSLAGLDAPTCHALEALWLHDAQKEHASVPAFSRLSWMLIAVGAPADLVEAVHVAALEEIDHTRRCFALAAGYGGRSHSTEPMPDLLLGGALDLRGDVLSHLAVESLKDGCLLEDYNADVAVACHAACRDEATGDVLARIAREERSHAELSWRIVGFAVARGGDRVLRAVERAAEELGAVARPTAVSAEKLALVAAADAAALRRHGRLPDGEWAPLWTARLAATATRIRTLLDGERAAA